MMQERGKTSWEELVPQSLRGMEAYDLFKVMDLKGKSSLDELFTSEASAEQSLESEEEEEEDEEKSAESDAYSADDEYLSEGEESIWID